MNSDNIRAQSGNAMVYILIALALFGLLTAILARQTAQTDSHTLTDEMAQFESAQILSFAQSAQSVVNQMIMSGTSVSDLRFDLPNSASYDLPPSRLQVFHPQGGGLIRKEANPTIFTGTDTNPPPGYYAGRFNNFQWTRTGAHDVVLSAYQISRQVCEAINQKITGSKTIPVTTAGSLANLMVDDFVHTGTNEEFSTADCATGCEGYPMLCVSNAAGTTFGFYAILENL